VIGELLSCVKRRVVAQRINYVFDGLRLRHRCINIFAPNFAHLFGTKQYTNTLLCAEFT